MNEAEMYFTFAHKLWKIHPDAIKWLESQNYNWAKVPPENIPISLLQSETAPQKYFAHTDLDDKDHHESVLMGIGKRKKSFGCACTDFILLCKWITSFDHPLIFSSQ